MKKLRFLLACLSVFMIAATSCSKSDSEKEEKGENIVGTWEYLYIRNDGHLYGDAFFIQFDKNGVFYSLYDGEIEWSSSKNKYVILDEFPFDKPYYKANYTINGNTLTLDCIELYNYDDYQAGFEPKTKKVSFNYTISGNKLILSGGDSNYFPSWAFGYTGGTLTKSSISLMDYINNKESYWKKNVK